jgi:hypothetical protein
MDARRIFTAAGLEGQFVRTCEFVIRSLGPGGFLEAGRLYFEDRHRADNPIVTAVGGEEGTQPPLSVAPSPRGADAGDDDDGEDADSEED